MAKNFENMQAEVRKPALAVRAKELLAAASAADGIAEWSDDLEKVDQAARMVLPGWRRVVGYGLYRSNGWRENTLQLQKVVSGKLITLDIPFWDYNEGWDKDDPAYMF